MKTYYHRETIDKHTTNIKELLDLNFGKDWRLFIGLFYSEQYGYHWFNFQNPSDVEKNRFKYDNVGGIVRKAYWSNAIKIMKLYLDKGKEETLKEIQENKYRFKWGFKKEEPQKVIISDELFLLSKKSKNAPTVSDVKSKEEIEEEKELEIVAEVLDLQHKETLLNVEYDELNDKDLAGELTPEEGDRYKELKKEINKLRRLIARKEAYIQT